MACARCTICALNFPLDEQGRLCPVCASSNLEGLANDEPDDPTELERLVNNASFQRYLEANDRA